MASAVNVEAITFIPAIPGTTMSRLSCGVIDPMISRKTIGRKKLKKAAVGLRQNCLRSRRNWRQPRVRASDTDGLLGGQLEVDVLERRAGDGEVAHGAAAGEGLAGQLVPEPRRVVDLALVQLAVFVAPADVDPLRVAHTQ